MKFYYDLHIHSGLSPCGDKEMTPNNIVNMAIIKGLDIISVTDHNSTKNLPAIKKVAEKSGIKIIYGIEVTSKEEVHLLCYFKRIEDAETFGNLIYESLPNIKNDVIIFGEQNIYNSKDEIIGNLEKLLLNACAYSIDEIFYLSKKYNGIMVPAHVNKKANSVLCILGFMPFNLNIEFIEVYLKEQINEKLLLKYKVLINSDAHYLTDIQEAVNSIELNVIDEIYGYLKI